MKKFVPKKSKQPFVYYAFWFLMVCLVVLIAVCCYQNIIPYEIVAKRVIKEADKVVSSFDIFGNQIKLTIGWLVAFFVWAVIQGLQIGYLLLSESEKALNFMIRKTESKGHYSVRDQDSEGLKRVKRSYNDSPLSIYYFFSFSRLVAYGIEIVVNFTAYPAWDGGLPGLLWAMVDWSKFRVDNLVLLIITLVVVEYTVFSAIMVWRLIEVFKQSGAYSSDKKSA